MADSNESETTPNTSEHSLTSEQIALYGTLIVGQQRIYDVLLQMYMQMDQEGAIALRKMHMEGRTWFPPPSFREDDENDISN